MQKLKNTNQYKNTRAKLQKIQTKIQKLQKNKQLMKI